MNTKAVVQQGSALARSAGKFGAGVAGFGVGAFLVKKFPKTNIGFFNGIVDKVLPGFTGILIAYLLGKKYDNQYAKAVAFGLGIAGVSDLFIKTLGPSLPSWVIDNTPKLSGAPGYRATNQGDFPPSYYKENAFQGVPVQGVPMQGIGNNAFDLSGGGMGNNAFALAGPYSMS